MPSEIKTKDEFLRLAESATEVRISRKGDSAKLKLRTGKLLYTFKTSGEDVDALTKGLKADVIEF